MKYAIVGKENRKVYLADAGVIEEVSTVVNGEPKIIEEIHPPRCSPHKEVIEISNAKAARIAATDDDHTAIWFIQPDGTLESLAERQALIVPESVTRRGLRKALLTIGVRFDAHVKAAIDAMPDGNDKDRALIDLEDAQTFRRDHPLVASVGEALNKTDEEVDALFILAATLGG
jgi:hypothetical protein